MKHIVLDLEATCWQGKAPAPNEIIEIGAVCVDENAEVIDEFVTFVKPSKSTQLSDFCTELTSITQDMVDNAPYFPQAVASFQEWIASFEDDYFLCSWGFYDKSQFKKDCKLHDLDIEWLKNHISVKHQYQKIKPTERPIGMKWALELENIPLEGTHHRGIDDARNIAKIFIRHFGKWKFE